MIRILRIFSVATLVIIMSAVTAFSQSSIPAQQSRTNGQHTMARFLGLTTIKGGTTEVFQWRPGNEIESAHPDIDFTKYFPVLKAVINEDIEEYFPLHNFSINSNGKRLYIDNVRNLSSLDSIQFNGVRGVYKIIWDDKLPVRFILNKNNKDTSDAGMKTGTSNPRIGFEWFTVTYYPDGLPMSIDGQLTQEFGGDMYSEIYSDYEFDQFGNWIKRSVLQRYGAGSDARKSKTKEYRGYAYDN